MTVYVVNKQKHAVFSKFSVMKLGVISTAKGSAYVELGRTKVIVSVFDPREIPKQNKYWWCTLHNFRLFIGHAEGFFQL
jgi:hypothetical protein